MKIEIKPDADILQKVTISDDIAKTYLLDKWAEDFWLMTAGYRDRLDSKDIHNPDAPFNSVTIMICSEAKARVFKRKLLENETAHVHIGGEVRPHTQDFIKLMARVYAANNFIVHLRKKINTTPIWYSSFGIAYEEFQSGDNFTASHSRCDKGGWKPLDSMGKQLLIEEKYIVQEVRNIVKNRETICLSPWNHTQSIQHDFDVDEAYLDYQKKVIGENQIQYIRDAGEKGFKTIICTVGGSMKATTERLFESLNISHGNSGVVRYIYGDEDSTYHGLGTINGENFGVDPGKELIYKNVGIQEKILVNEANLAIIWDPDGDRIKIASPANLAVKEELIKIGVEIDERSTYDRCVAYFTPNQLYVMIAAFRLESLRANGQFDKYNWFIGSSYPTTKALEQIAHIEGIPYVQVPVGFKYIGDLCEQIEKELGNEFVFTTTTGKNVYLGRKPRAIILCEESGGANIGGSELLVSRTGKNKMLALREKDGMQIGLIMMALAAKLSMEKSSLADYYLSTVNKRNIHWLHYIRKDPKLYDESFGPGLKNAKKEGLQKRDRTMDFFKNKIDNYQKGKTTLVQLRENINQLLPPGAEGFPELCGATWISDGPMLESENLRFILRASGTDAVLRYYIEGKNLTEIEALLDATIKLNVN